LRFAPERKIDDVTICIAAASKYFDRIIFVTDQLLTNEYATAEGAPKYAILEDLAPWVVMYTTRNSNEFAPLLRAIQARLTGRTLDAVTNACRDGYRDRLRVIREMDVLSGLGWSEQEFYEHGERRLGTKAFAAKRREMERVDTTVTMLIAGFDSTPPRGYHILTVTPRGYVDEETQMFHAIGSGSGHALAALQSFADIFQFSEDFEEIIYRMCTAKFSSEAQQGGPPDVGESTFLAIVNRGASYVRFLVTDQIAELRKIWEQEQRSTPERARTLLQQWLVK
jgi:hypothetical protein